MPDQPTCRRCGKQAEPGRQIHGSRWFCHFCHRWQRRPMPDDLTALLRRELAEYPRRQRVSVDVWAQLVAARLAEVAVDHYESWDGLMSILDKHYPADVPLLCDENSPDPGPRIVALVRHLNAARESESEAAALLTKLVEWGWGSDAPAAYVRDHKDARAYLARHKEASR